MPTLTPPSTATYTTTVPNEFVSVVCTGATDQMLVTWVGPAGTSGRRTVVNTTTDGEEIGPFLNGTTVTFTALAGSPVYTAPAFAAPVQSLVSGAWNGPTMPNITLPAGKATMAAALPNFVAAAKQSRAGVVTRIGWLGNSTTVGYGSTGAANYVNVKRQSPSVRLASMLDGLVRPAGVESWMGNNASDTAGSTTFPQYDPRIALGAGWQLSPQASLGKNSLENSTTTNAFSFTPINPFDTIELYYFSNTAPVFGIFTVNVDGGATLSGGTIDANAAKTMRKVTLSCARGYHTINIVPPGTAYTILAGMIAYDSANPGIQVLNLGYAGATAATLKGSGTLATSNVIGTLGCKLVILGNLINDWVAGTSLATFKTDTQTLITAALAGGTCDVVLITDIPTASGVASYATQAGYLDVYRQLAAENGLVLIDWYAQSGGTYEAANAAGLMYDDRHESALGYTKKAEMVSSALYTALR